MENKTTEKIKGILFLIFFVGAIFGMIIFAETQPSLCFSCFGAILLFFAIATTMDIFSREEKFARDFIPPIILFYAGICLTGLPILFLYSPAFAQVNQTRISIQAVTLGFALVGAVITISETVHLMMQKKQCTMPITAKCIEQKHISDFQGVGGNTSRRTRSFAYIFEFYYNGQRYEVVDEIASNMDSVSPGMSYEIYINPYDPGSFYRKTPKQIIAIYVLGVMFLLVGIGTFLIY